MFTFDTKPKPKPVKVNKGSVFPDDLYEVQCYRSPIPVRQPAPTKDNRLQRLIKKAVKDASLNLEIESILFFYEISFQRVDFELGHASDRGEKDLFPIGPVRAQGSVSPLTWIAAASEIANALLKRQLGMFLVDIVPGDIP